MPDHGPAEIRELDARTVERIAAGEVVERPASVVKELVENAIDADASRVDVTVEAGGTESIRVSDDGLGMTETGVRRAVEEHTTSKIDDIDDLEAGVGTLGFRGEALHAIGAVSRLTITTRPRDGDRGTELVVEGGEVTSVSPAGVPSGTTVEIADLFYNVPARRKYLKQESTEFAHVNGVVTGYALANPGVAVSLSHGSREVFATTGGGNLREAVLAVYGREVAQAMVPVAFDELPEGPLESVSGLVSHPETTRASRDYLNTFVNGRYVRATSVREAIVDAYGTQLAPDRYPFAVLESTVDPGAVDVNVHPRKLEVRFADEDGVRNQVEAAVNAALMREGLVRSGAPRGTSAPAETPVDPGGEASESDEGDRDVPAPESGVDAGDSSRRTGRDRDGRSVGAGRESGRDGPEPTGPPETDTSGTREPDRGAHAAGRADRKFRGDVEQASLGDASSADGREGFDSLPAMRILGQFRDTYVVADTADGLVLVDQHAADERIHYERLRATVDDGVATQELARPVDLSVTTGEAALADARRDALAELGFRMERVDDHTLRVTAVPSLVAEAAEPALLRDVLGALVGGEGRAASTVEAAADDLLADLACYPAVTGNVSLTEGSIRDLLAALDECENPYACPHGRPVLVELSDADVEARFERDYPGHGG
jgi:DNA mismatch repair protein MutL